MSPTVKAFVSSPALNAHAKSAAAPSASRIACVRCRSASFSKLQSSLASVGLAVAFLNVMQDVSLLLFIKVAIALPSNYLMITYV